MRPLPTRESAVSVSPSPRPAPKTPRIHGVLGGHRGSRVIVSDHADSLAVGGVWSELVSAVSSLMCRERTGKFSDVCLPSHKQSPNSQAFPQPQRPIHCDQEQGIRFDEQGSPGRQHRPPSPGARANLSVRVLGPKVRVSVDLGGFACAASRRFHFGSRSAEF